MAMFVCVILTKGYNWQKNWMEESICLPSEC